MSCKFFLQPWLRIMNKFATIVAQNEQICKKEAPPPHVEPPHMWSIHLCGSSTCGGTTIWRLYNVEAPQCGGSKCGGSTYVEHHGCAKCTFVQPWLRKIQICTTMVAKMQICATILQIYSNLQGAEVVPPPKEVVPPPKEVVRRW